jgi:hypothetical protein
MSVDVPLGCLCGEITGVVVGVTRANSRRLACMCDDCQVYAHHLGRADELLDAYGGTDLSYATQSRITITAGAELLRAVRLYPNGLLRVYAGCCRTPVAHVPSPKMAFVGIPHLFMRDVPRDALLGPLVRRFQGRFARGEMPPGAHRGTPFGPWLAAMWTVVWDSLRGRQRPSAFHELRSGAPTMPTHVIAPAELAALRGDSHLLGEPLGCS